MIYFVLGCLIGSIIVNTIYYKKRKNEFNKALKKILNEIKINHIGRMK
jgi:hypothetical protein